MRLARFTGVRRDQLQPRILRATIMQARGDSDDAAHELTLCADDAATNRWPRLEAVAVHHRGKVYFERGDFERALVDFRHALALREDAKVGEDQLESSRIAIAVAESYLNTGSPFITESGGNGIPAAAAPAEPASRHAQSAPARPAPVTRDDDDELAAAEAKRQAPNPLFTPTAVPARAHASFAGRESAPRHEQQAPRETPVPAEPRERPVAPLVFGNFSPESRETPAAPVAPVAPVAPTPSAEQEPKREDESPEAAESTETPAADRKPRSRDSLWGRFNASSPRGRGSE